MRAAAIVSFCSLPRAFCPTPRRGPVLGPQRDPGGKRRRSVPTGSRPVRGHSERRRRQAHRNPDPCGQALSEAGPVTCRGRCRTWVLSEVRLCAPAGRPAAPLPAPPGDRETEPPPLPQRLIRPGAAGARPRPQSFPAKRLTCAKARAGRRPPEWWGCSKRDPFPEDSPTDILSARAYFCG